jgi:hypothetical protein
MLLAAQFAGASILCAPPPLLATAPLDITWRLDNLDRIGGHPVTVAGTPRVVETDRGPAVEFNGRTDGLFIEANPLEGFARFTIDVSVQPAPGGPEEQRFLHIEEADTGNRALVELRMPLPSADGPEPRWSLDTYLRSAPAALTLLDRSVTHPAGRWHVVTLSYDGRTMSHWVDGVRELSGAIAFAPLGRGRTSVGVRQNRVSWFKGRIRQIVFRGESGSTGSGRAGPGGEP